MELRGAGRGGAGPRQQWAGLSLHTLSTVLGAMHVAGGVLALSWLGLPHGDGRGDGTARVLALLAVSLGCVLVVCARRVVPWVLHAALGAIQVVIGVACLATGELDSDLRLFFLWTAPNAALCFGRRASAAHLAWTATLAVITLLAMPQDRSGQGLSGALMLLGTLVAGWGVVSVAAQALRGAEAVARHQATHDTLTGLGNRRTLLDALHASAGTSGDCALVLLNLDGFKAVNDQYGHGRGDEVLQEVARQLTRVARAGDVVCRLGGDEFALVVHGVQTEQDAQALAQRLADAVTLHVRDEDAVGAGRRPLAVRASAGVRLLPAVPAVPAGASTALREADVALYASKSGGRASAVVWRDGMRRPGQDLDELAEDLQVALREQGQLRLVYQPVVDTGTLQVRGVEALARWRHPVRGDVSPEVFVACAERSGLVGELTRWVLRTACADARDWPVGLDGAAVNLALNISALQLADLQIVDDVQAALAASGRAPAELVLEVTETAEVVDLVCAQRTLSALADLGVHLALDDFGTGHSSLTHVQALPFHILKVDRSFVAAAAAGDRRALATIAAVGALASRLDVDVVAEGVEDAHQLAGLRELGCGYAQGYALLRPVDPQVVTAALKASGLAGWVLPDGVAVPAQR